MNAISRSSVVGALLFAAIGCSQAASTDGALPSEQALSGTARALIVRGLATSPRGRLVASPALGFGDSGGPAEETALCFAGAVNAVCATIAAESGSSVRLDDCEVDADTVAVRYSVSGGAPVSRTIARCADTAGSAESAPAGTFVVASSARRDDAGDVVAGVALGFSIDPNAPGPVSFCYAGASADVCGLVQAYADSASVELQDCSVDSGTVTASYAVNDDAGDSVSSAAILLPCGR